MQKSSAGEIVTGNREPDPTTIEAKILHYIEMASPSDQSLKLLIAERFGLSPVAVSEVFEGLLRAGKIVLKDRILT